MGARYGRWHRGSPILQPQGCSFIWADICSQGPFVLDHMRFLLGDGQSIDLHNDAWVSDLPLARWPTFVSMDLDEHLCTSDLISADRCWRADLILQSFGSSLAARILAIPIPRHPCPDFLEWDPSHRHHAWSSDCPGPTIQASWIWKVPAHPRALIFLWKVAWDRLPTRTLLSHRGLAVPEFCPVCGLYDETAEHTLLRCSRSRLIWHTACLSSWESDQRPWLSLFLDTIRCSPPETAGRIVYIAYHIWLSRNKLVFEDLLVPIPRLIRTAIELAREFLSPAAVATSLDGLVPSDSPAAPAASLRAILVSWEPPPPGFVKVNFDGSVRGSEGGAGYVIRDSEGALLAAGGIHLTEPSVLQAELTAAWAGVSCAVHRLGARRLYLEGDSAAVVSWLRQRAQRSFRHPLLLDISSFLCSVTDVSVRHIFREGNTAADWVASFVATHSGGWTCPPRGHLPSSFALILYSDYIGHSRTRFV